RLGTAVFVFVCVLTPPSSSSFPYATLFRSLLEHPERPPAYVEVKNVHFMRQRGLAEFPDTVTARGARHLDELVSMREQGARAIIDRKSTRLNSSHVKTSYAVFCLEKKNSLP